MDYIVYSWTKYLFLFAFTFSAFCREYLVNYEQNVTSYLNITIKLEYY